MSRFFVRSPMTQSATALLFGSFCLRSGPHRKSGIAAGMVENKRKCSVGLSPVSPPGSYLKHLEEDGGTG